MALLYSSLSVSTSTNASLPNLPFFRNQPKNLPCRKRIGMYTKFNLCSTPISKPTSEDGFPRRELLLFGLTSSVALFFPSLGSLAEEELKSATMVDEINAYSYTYPVELSSTNFAFKWVESRKPERYSSAAPLSPDARLRIVSERVDFIDNLIISIGPPNSIYIKSKDKSTWAAKDVADSVLSDKSALRVTSSQRMAESSVLDTNSSNVGESNIYRHYVASTAERDGFLYTINASTLGAQWNTMGPFLQKTVESFRLLPPTEDYVPPYKDPWRFW
ncbi:psbP domain-containing protein 5, chloroplastic isoform X5 [Cucumis melo]|uniref:PsbP domain-containing protein 5, chloroplastic isoform X5 n=1 Tax=Cucumis melo TaxID=3656 RepID=A0ABM3KK89_CUCME|nr:psbP domain-containing protein 5, chloroplastic isoform X5 [Cucumis melo]